MAEQIVVVPAAAGGNEPTAERPDGAQPKKPLLTTIREEWHKFHTFVWNSEKKEFIGRTGKSCAQITLFYICFYTCLAGFWAALFAIFYQTISLDEPTYKSLITPPGLNLIPFTIDGKQIQYGTAEGNEARTRIEEQIQKNVIDVLSRDQSTFIDCENLGPADSSEESFCQYDLSLLGPCASNGSFATDKPCLYMGINKVLGWVPENYESDELPSELTDIRNQLNLNGTTNDRIAVTCVKCDRDNETNCSPIDVYPSYGISFGHYPYKMGTDSAQQALYVRPVVAAQVPINVVGQAFRVSCRAWASNLDEPLGGLFYSRAEPARFSIRIMRTE